LQTFTEAAVVRLLADPNALACALGEVLSEPKRGVWFDTGEASLSAAIGVRLDPRTRMLYDDAHVFVNGESFRAAGRDAKLMRRLADQRALDAADVDALSVGARELLADWLAAGWVLRSDR
jgi:50S ribosomal protein L16 3-hydroxylase